jgi:hypothetical protein
MAEFEIIALTLSLILGLSVAQMLSAVALAFRSRRESPLHWLPFSWATAIFLFHIQFWFVIHDLDSIAPAWTWDWYGPVLLLAVLLFLSGAVILPTRDRELASGLLEDFETHGRFALIPVSLYLLIWIPMNHRMDVPWIAEENAYDVILGVLAAVTFLSRGRRVRAAASLTYLVVAAWAVFVVWSRPGV